MSALDRLLPSIDQAPTVASVAVAGHLRAMRRLLPALLCALLCACGQPDADQPFAESRIPPNLAPRFWPPEGWAWGLVQIPGHPPVRYGVSSPDGVRPRGQVLILVGFGESAEAWFETVRALNAEHYVVWVMDGVGQGGSGRYGAARDVAYAPDLGVEVQAVAALTRLAGEPPLVIAQTTAAPTALLAVAGGAEAKGIVLSAPVLDAAEPPVSAGRAVPTAAGFDRVRLGALRAAGQPRWRRPEDIAAGRMGVIASWQVANPDLRFGGASWGWIEAFQRHAGGLTAERLGQVRVPVRLLEPASRGGRKAEAACRTLPDCTRRSIAGGRGALHLEGDAVYRRWIAAVQDALAHPKAGA
jgi:lysophospholipase